MSRESIDDFIGQINIINDEHDFNKSELDRILIEKNEMDLEMNSCILKEAKLKKLIQKGKL